MTKLSRVCDSIVGRIETGSLREGDRLPSEAQLAAGFRVSVGTVQKALARLAHSGLISREHGRGTFVSASLVQPADLNYLRFRDRQGRELSCYVTLKSVRRLRRPGPWSEFLGREEDGFIRIERMISAGGKVDLHSEFWLRGAEFARLRAVDRRALEKNLRLLLGQKLLLPTLRVDQAIRFEPPPEAVADALGLEPGQPGFVMELRGYTLRDRPLYYQRVCAAPFNESFIVVR
jgi:DNA-binding GntR family transcriptional regulator